MDQDEKLWQEFNDWHRTRYGWRVHEDLRNHPRENFYAWEAWKAGFANAIAKASTSTAVGALVQQPTFKAAFKDKENVLDIATVEDLALAMPRIKGPSRPD